MAGGTWSSQNKFRPGVYIRFRSEAAGGLTPGDRGVAAICKPLSWGPVGEMMEVESGADMTPFTGYGITDGRNLFLREIFKGTDRTSGPRTVLLYRPAATGAAAAQAAIPGPAAREGDGTPSAGLLVPPSTPECGATTFPFFPPSRRTAASWFPPRWTGRLWTSRR